MRRGRARRGFGLTELLAIVAVGGLLALMAFAGCTRRADRAHVAEAYGMLGMIRMRQESYRSSYSQYCDIAGNHGATGEVGAPFPDSPPSPTPVPWRGNATLAERWRQLGVNPAGMVYYRYDSPAGNPGVPPAFGNGLGYASAVNQDAWWAAHAYGDLDGDGVRSTFEAFSMTRGVWVTPDEAE